MLIDNKNLNWGALKASYTVNASLSDATHKTLHGLSVTKVPITINLWIMKPLNCITKASNIYPHEVI